MPIFLRAALFSVPRFILILGMVIGLNRLDVSPLPMWTVALLSYILHFLITFLFTLWVMRRRLPTWGQVIGVTLIFLGMGVLWEMGLYMWITQSSFSDVIAGFTRNSFYLLVIYACASLFAGAYARRKRIETVASVV